MKKKLIGIFTILMTFLTIGQPVFASGDMNFSVHADIPENQIDKALTYFDLKMKPGQKQTITITVTNTDNKPATIMITPNNAFTNQNGVIDYSKTNKQPDKTMKHPFTSLVTGESKISLAANETKAVPYQIQMPKESYDGVVLGGFYIQKQGNDDSEKSKDSVQIKNVYSYVIGAKLTETDAVVKPEVLLNKIVPSLDNYHTSVAANLQNTQPVIVSNLKVVAKVTKKGSKEVLHETTKENMSIAPNSNFDYSIDWDNQPLDPGEYTLSLVATSGDHEWPFEKDFKIKGEKAKDLNKEAVELEQKDNTLLYILIALVIVLLVAILALLIFFMLKRKKNDMRFR